MNVTLGMFPKLSCPIKIHLNISTYSNLELKPKWFVIINKNIPAYKKCLQKSYINWIYYLKTHLL